RQDRPQLRVTPVESDRFQTPDVTNVQGTKDYSLADVYMGIWRNIEHLSRAEHAYDTALQHATEHGFGFLELRQIESRYNPFVQDLKVCRIKNSYTIYLDPAAQEADFADAQDAFKFSHMNRTAFERKYPNKNAGGEFNQGSSGGTYEGWYDKEGLRIAEYFWIDYVDDEVIMMSNGKIHFLSEVKDVLDEMEEKQGIYIAKANDEELRKKVKRPKCMWQKMTATEVLEGPQELVFDQIPLFPVLGDEVMLEGRTHYESAIRHARDPQKSYNYWRTAAAETVALAPKAPWILTDEQVEGHEDEWEAANTHNLPFLSYRYMEGQPAPTRNFPAQVAAA
ncbi:MAG: hypothetical protein MJA83_17320, partial [Gammaproteobacteria bacterium]|nr:hypothetical protein [Gammaproteobacteria bacterium]